MFQSTSSTYTIPFGAIACVLALVGGVLASLLFLVFCLAGSPNSSPEQLRFIKWLMIGAAAVGVLSVGGAIVLLTLGHPWFGSIVAALPIVMVIVTTVIAFTR